MKDCNHDKVYADYVLLTNPPQYPWICRKCGKKDVDIETYYDENESYSDIEKRFDKEK